MRIRASGTPKRVQQMWSSKPADAIKFRITKHPVANVNLRLAVSTVKVVFIKKDLLVSKDPAAYLPKDTNTRHRT